MTTLQHSGVVASREYFVSDGRQELPFVGSGVVQPGDVLGTSPAPLVRVPFSGLDWPDPIVTDPSVDTVGSVETLEPNPPHLPC